MSEHTFKTGNTGTEYPAIYSGQEYRFQKPDAVPGDLDATLENIRAVCKSEDDFATILAGKFNGQGYVLDWQKELKGFLGKTVKDAKENETSAHEGKTPEEVQALAEAHMAEFRLVATRPSSGKSGSAKAKVAKAEATANVATDGARTMYLQLNKSARRGMRDSLLAAGDPFNEELLDAWDAEAA